MGISAWRCLLAQRHFDMVTWTWFFSDFWHFCRIGEVDTPFTEEVMPRFQTKNMTQLKVEASLICSFLILTQLNQLIDLITHDYSLASKHNGSNAEGWEVEDEQCEQDPWTQHPSWPNDPRQHQGWVAGLQCFWPIIPLQILEFKLINTLAVADIDKDKYVADSRFYTGWKVPRILLWGQCF